MKVKEKINLPVDTQVLLCFSQVFGLGSSSVGWERGGNGAGGQEGRDGVGKVLYCHHCLCRRERAPMSMHPLRCKHSHWGSDSAVDLLSLTGAGKIGGPASSCSPWGPAGEISWHQFSVVWLRLPGGLPGLYFKSFHMWEEGAWLPAPALIHRWGMSGPITLEDDAAVKARQTWEQGWPGFWGGSRWGPGALLIKLCSQKLQLQEQRLKLGKEHRHYKTGPPLPGTALSMV